MTGNQRCGEFADRGYESRRSSSRFRVRCEARGESAAGADSSGGYGFRPLKPIAVEQFRLEFRSGSHDQKFSFIANFVYVDGAYRFVGGGGAAFWAKPGVNR